MSLLLNFAVNEDKMLSRDFNYSSVVISLPLSRKAAVFKFKRLIVNFRLLL